MEKCTHRHFFSRLWVLRYSVLALLGICCIVGAAMNLSAYRFDGHGELAADGDGGVVEDECVSGCSYPDDVAGAEVSDMQLGPRHLNVSFFDDGDSNSRGVRVDAATQRMLTDVYGMTPEQAMQDYANAREYLEAPFIRVPTYARHEYQAKWRFLRLHVQEFAAQPRKRAVPLLRRSSRLTRQQFIERYMITSTPVVVPFDAMRHLGWATKSLTMEEMLELYPKGKKHTPPWRCSKGYYPWEAQSKKENKNTTLDLGPGLRRLARGLKIKKWENFKSEGHRGRHYSFPRNFKLPRSQLSPLNISKGPPFVDDRLYQKPAIWMASSSSVTAWHHDCCDNMNMQMMGTKSWILSPPTDCKNMYNKCGTKEHPKAFCRSGVGIKNWSFNRVKDRLNFVEVDLRPGHVLYLPAGWFHAVEKPSPDASKHLATLSVNFWFKSDGASLAFNRARRGCKDLGLGWRCIAREEGPWPGWMQKID